MIDDSGWLSWAERVPGPVEKQYTQPNSVEGYIPHSMVGTLNGWYSRLFDMSRTPTGRFTTNAAASVHGSILLNGHVIQHYPFLSSCWASGNRKANTTKISFENESMYTNGMPDETIPFTELELLSNVRIIEELADWKGWIPARSLAPEYVPATLMEHNEAVKIWGGYTTACPSDRTKWNKILFLLNKGEKIVDKVFVFYNGHLFAERSGDFPQWVLPIHWYILNDEIRQSMIDKADWPTTIKYRKPIGVRVDW